MCPQAGRDTLDRITRAGSLLNDLCPPSRSHNTQIRSNTKAPLPEHVAPRSSADVPVKFTASTSMSSYWMSSKTQPAGVSTIAAERRHSWTQDSGAGRGVRAAAYRDKDPAQRDSAAAQQARLICCCNSGSSCFVANEPRWAAARERHTAQREGRGE